MLTRLRCDSVKSLSKENDYRKRDTKRTFTIRSKTVCFEYQSSLFLILSEFLQRSDHQQFQSSHKNYPETFYSLCLKAFIT